MSALLTDDLRYAFKFLWWPTLVGGQRRWMVRIPVVQRKMTVGYTTGPQHDASRKWVERHEWHTVGLGEVVS